jgi:putative Mn2+ efflux pump MntP
LRRGRLLSNKYLNFDSNICGHLPAKYITCFYKNRKIYLLIQGIFGVSIKELQASLLRRFVMLCFVLIIVFFVTIIIPVNVFDVPKLGVYSDFYSSYIHFYNNWIPPIIIVFYGIFYMLMPYYRERIDDILAKEFSKFFDRVKKCNL